MEIGRVDQDTIWVRHREGVEYETCRLWQMSLHVANDLAEWWRAESRDVRSGETRIRDKRVGDICVSMFVPNLIRIQGLGKQGKTDAVVYLLPPSVVDYLTNWLQRTRGNGNTHAS